MAPTLNKSDEPSLLSPLPAITWSHIWQIIPVSAIASLALIAYLILIFVVVRLKSKIESGWWSIDSPCRRPDVSCGGGSIDSACTDCCWCQLVRCQQGMLQYRRGSQSCLGCGICVQVACDSCSKLGTAEGPSCPMDCSDCVTCQCCADPSNRCCPCCHFTEPLCDCCSFSCRCAATEYRECNCGCCTIVIGQRSSTTDICR